MLKVRNEIIISHMWLLPFKLMKIKYNQTFSSSVARGKFEVLSGYTWLQYWSAHTQSISIAAESSLGSAGWSHLQIYGGESILESREYKHSKDFEKGWGEVNKQNQMQNGKAE